VIITPSQDPNAYQPLPINFRQSLTLKAGVYYLDWTIGENTSYTYIAKPPGMWKFCIPNGTIRVGVLGFAAQSVQAGMLLRMENPPENLEIADWDTFEWTRDGSVPLENFKFKSYAFRKGDGMTQPIYQPFSSPLPYGGWLYGCNLGSFYAVQVTLWIDATTFDAWAKTIQWDANGNPIFEPVVPPMPEIKQVCTVKPATTRLVVKMGRPGRDMEVTVPKDVKRMFLTIER